MGNYSCYNCGKEFWTLGGLRKHSEQHKCPKLTPGMIQRSAEPFRRILIEIHDVIPAIKKDRFMESRRFEIRNSEDLEKAEPEIVMEIKKLLRKNFNDYYQKDVFTQ